MTDFISQKKALDELSSIYSEAVYGGKKEEKKDTRMVVTNADKKANTPAYQNLKKGDKRYKAADHMKESNWRDDLRELVGDYDRRIGNDADSQQSKKPDNEVIVKEKNVKNKVVIDPVVKLEQLEKEVGGKVISIEEKMTTAALEDTIEPCPDCGEPKHEDECVAEEEKNTVEEEILWDRVARDLTKLGEMYDCKFKVEGYPEQLDEKLAKGTKRVSFSTGRDDNYNQAMKEKNPRTGRMRATSPELKAIGAHSRHKKKQWDAEAKGDHKAAAKHKSRRDAQAFTVYQKTKRIIDRADND